MVLFEWDEAKAKGNKRKHGVSFDDAMLVFADPSLLSNRTVSRTASSAGKHSAWQPVSCFCSWPTQSAAKQKMK